MVANFGVIGDPIEHSLSERLHTAAYEFLEVDWRYQKVRVPSGSLKEFIESLDHSWRGLSVTMPHKVGALALADSHDDASAKARGANTLLLGAQENSREIRAYNTDVMGLTHALQHTGWSVSELGWILGGGATARSALLAMAHLGVKDFRVVVRNPIRAAGLKTLALELGVEGDFVTPEMLINDHSLRITGLVVNTLPSGVNYTELGLFPVKFNENTRLYEVAYDLWPSPMAQTVLDRDGAATSGITMLVEQALLQLRLFYHGTVEEQLPRELEILAAMRASVATN